MSSSPQPVVAAFDFDGTLARGGSVWQFLVSMAGRPRVIAAGIREAPRILYAALVGGTANDRAKEALFFRVLAGRDFDEISRRAAEFGLVHFSNRERPEIEARLRWHLEQGHKAVLVSASPELYLLPVANKLGAAGVVGTRLEVDDRGKLTGHYDGANCRGPEKARRLREWISDLAKTDQVSQGSEMADPESPPTEKPFVWAYGNSAGDREMLRNADVGVDVGRLGRFGKLKSFPKLADVVGRDQSGPE